MNGLDLETVFLLSGLIAAWSGTIVACMHAAGILPPRYKRQLTAIQQATAKTIGESIRSSIAELAQTSDAAATAQGQAFVAQLSQSVAQATQAAVAPLAAEIKAAVAPIADRTESAIRDGLGALAETVTAIQASSAGAQLGAASGTARNEKALAKTGARRLLAQYANAAGPIPGAIATGAMALGMIDEKSIMEAAEFLLENPELAQKLQNAYNGLREKKGVLGGSSGYAPGIGR